MLVLVDSSVKVDFYVQDVPDVAWDLIEVADKPIDDYLFRCTQFGSEPACGRRKRGNPCDE